MAFMLNLTGTSAVDDSIITAFASEVEIQAGQDNVLDGLVSKRIDINAKSISIPRYARLAPATTPLTETDDTVAVALSDSKVIITPLEYGRTVGTTKLANLQTGGMVDMAAAQVIGTDYGVTMDKLAINALAGTTNIITPTGAAVGSLSATNDKITRTFLGVLRNKLVRANVPKFSNGNYALVVHPDVIHDLIVDASAGSYTDLAKYAAPEMALFGEVVNFMGFYLVPDMNVPVATTGVDAYSCFAFGRNAIGKGISHNSELIVKQASDNLNRFVTFSWYEVCAYALLDASNVWCGVTASSLGANGA